MASIFPYRVLKTEIRHTEQQSIGLFLRDSNLCSFIFLFLLKNILAAIYTVLPELQVFMVDLQGLGK